MNGSPVIESMQGVLKCLAHQVGVTADQCGEPEVDQQALQRDFRATRGKREFRPEAKPTGQLKQAWGKPKASRFDLRCSGNAVQQGGRRVQPAQARPQLGDDLALHSRAPPVDRHHGEDKKGNQCHERLAKAAEPFLTEDCFHRVEHTLAKNQRREAARLAGAAAGCHLR
jgi:hypothetical protein